MRVATSFALWCAILLGACQRERPDFALTISSPGEGHKAALRGFQPRGTIEGYILLSFGDDFENAAVIRQVENGQMGWVGSDTFVVVADRLKFDSLSSDYFPDGTVKSRIRVVVCARQDMDCSYLMEYLAKGSDIRRISHFPEG